MNASNIATVAAPVVPAETADHGRIRFGAGFRLAATRPAMLPPAKAEPEVADEGRIRFGAGFRLTPARLG